MNKVRTSFVTAAREIYGEDVDVLNREQIQGICSSRGLKYPAWFATPKYRVSRGCYSLKAMLDDVKHSEKEYVSRVSACNVQQQNEENSISEICNSERYVPAVDETFVSFGYASKLKKILKSEVFLPVFIAGLSGNGKSFIAEQVCAKLGREFVNVPITIETTEDDLLGGFRLVNGETVWSNGPVVEAMLRGAVLLLDEIDLASHKIMCLQSVIDGKGVYLKKINKYIEPEPGFNVIATANTKGKGKWKGQFVGTNILNEAFLERFAVLFEQDYPPPSVERRILMNNLANYGISNDDSEAKEFVSLLVEWGNQIRKSFNNEDIDEVVSTRRLVHIIKYYSVFRDKLDSVIEGTNRFSEANKEAFVELYKGLDSDPDLLNKNNIIGKVVGNDESDVEYVSVRV